MRKCMNCLSVDSQLKLFTVAMGCVAMGCVAMGCDSYCT